MVKEQNKRSGKRQENQGKAECTAKASKIGHSTPYDYCSERLSAYGGLLGLVKFMELILPIFLRGIWLWLSCAKNSKSITTRLICIIFVL